MNCILYRSTCTDSPLASARGYRSKRAQPPAAAVSRNESQQERDKDSQSLPEGQGAWLESSRRTPTAVSLEEDTLVQSIPQCSHDAQAAPDLPPNTHHRISSEVGLLSPSDPWYSNLYMPNVFDFADSPNISDLTNPSLVDFPQLNSIFPDTNERPLNARGERPASSTIRQPKVAGVHFLKEGLPSRKSASLLPGLFLKKDACESRYQGLNSIGGTLSSCLIYARNHSPDLGEYRLLEYLIQGITYMDEAANVRSSHTIGSQDLPDRSLVKYGVDSFFRNVYLRYPIVGLDLQHSWTEWYNSDGIHSSPDLIQFMCICIMVAIGVTAHPDPPTEETQEKALALQQRAWSQMDHVLAHPYTSSVQVILLHTLYFTQQGKLGIAWSTCGTALRVAESIGLHRHTPGDLQLSDELVRLRARLWWVAFSLDAFLSLCEGRPTGTSSDKTDTKIEALLAEECPDGCDQEPSSMIYTWHVTLARHVNCLADVIGREKSANERLHCLAELDADLMGWRDAIPLDFRPDQENLAPVQLRHHVTWLHVQFFNVLRTLHWTSTLLSSHIRDRDESLLTDSRYRRLQSSEAICVASARSLIRTSIYSRQPASDTTREFRMLGAPSAYFLTATSTIFMHILKEPQRLSATADVEYLRAGIHHLNSEFFAAQIGQGEEILRQMLQIAGAVTDPLKSVA
ncbi:fungal-specific transcription factor domain-containing protein [Aspergillus ambiguus]|uniref:fungal specific transcription factor domain-containing protein n=1 Tax=Aspergillus ambiguus TaxID=176160 RepID=UPI003CCD8249